MSLYLLSSCSHLGESVVFSVPAGFLGENGGISKAMASQSVDGCDLQ